MFVAEHKHLVITAGNLRFPQSNLFDLDASANTFAPLCEVNMKKEKQKNIPGTNPEEINQKNKNSAK